MLKRILSVCLSLIMAFGALGSLALTASAATTVSANERWNEDFNSATTTRQDGTRNRAFDQSYNFLKDSAGNFVFVKQGGGYGSQENIATYVTYLEEFAGKSDGNKMLHYNPVENASGPSLTLERSFGPGGAGASQTDANNVDSTTFNFDTLSTGTTYATSGAWNFSFDFYPVNSNERLIFSSVVQAGNEKSLFDYNNGSAALLDNTKSVALSNGQWYRFSFAADGNGKIEVYINGKKITEANNATMWTKLCWMYFKFQKIDGTIGEYYFDNFKVSDKASGFFGTGSAFDCGVTTSDTGIVIKDTTATGGATSTVVISESKASTLSAQDFVDTLTFASGSSDAIAELYDSTGEVLEDYDSTTMDSVSKMVVSTGHAYREYTIFVEEETFATSSYRVSHSDKKIFDVKMNTKVSDFLDAFSPIIGATLKVKKNGAELGNNDPITDGATLVSTHNGNEYTYSISFTKYWSEDFATVSGSVNYNGNTMKDSSNNNVFESERWVYRESTDAETDFFYAIISGEVTAKYEGNWIPSNNYQNGIYGGVFRSYLKEFDQDYDVKVKTNLTHKLKSDGKSGGTPITSSGAYNFEFAFKPQKTLFDLDINGVKTDDSEFTFISFSKGVYKAFGSDIDLSSVVADSNGFYNFKISYLENGVADVYVNGTLVGNKIAGGDNIKAVKFSNMAYFESGTSYADYYLDNIELYPIAYEAPATSTGATLYKDSVEDVNKVIAKSQLTGATKYIARGNITCYDSSISAMLVVAAYKDGALAFATSGGKTVTYGNSDYAQTEITGDDVATIENADRICIFLWNGTSLKPLNFVEFEN